jgi:hypothetical protein
MYALEYALGFAAKTAGKTRSEKGIGLVRSSIVLVGMLGLVLAVWNCLTVAYRFYDLRNQVSYLLASAEISSDLEIKKRVLSVIKGAGMSGNEQDIVLERAGDKVRAELPYRHELVFVVGGKQLRVASIPVKLEVERHLEQGQQRDEVDSPKQEMQVSR